MSGFYRFVRGVAKVIFTPLFRVKIIGLENVPQNGGVIMCANHTSLTDPIFLAINIKRQIHFMGKAELFGNCFTKWFFNKLGSFAVKRGQGDTGAIRTGEDVINSGGMMGIFPEGTRYLEGAPRKAKAGVAMIAASTKADILPVSIFREGKIHLFSKTTIRFGEVIPFEELKLNSEEGAKKSSLRYASELIMDRITKMWEMGY